MFNNRDFKAKHNSKSVLSSLLGALPVAFAEEDNPTPSSSEPTPQAINFETLIANARKEEKDKLYPRIKKLEEENKALLQSSNDSLLKIAEYQKSLEELKASVDNDPKIKELQEELDKVIKEKKSLEESMPKEEEIRNKVKAEYEVKLYRQQKLTENSEKILSVFADEVIGETKEEVDASFDKAVEKTLNTKKQLGLVDESGNPVVPKETKPDKKKPTTPPLANPEDAGKESFDMEYIQNLDPASPEYAEFRKKIGLK